MLKLVFKCLRFSNVCVDQQRKPVFQQKIREERKLCNRTEYFKSRNVGSVERRDRAVLTSNKVLWKSENSDRIVFSVVTSTHNF